MSRANRRGRDRTPQGSQSLSPTEFGQRGAGLPLDRNVQPLLAEQAQARQRAQERAEAIRWEARARAEAREMVMVRELREMAMAAIQRTTSYVDYDYVETPLDIFLRDWPLLVTRLRRSAMARFAASARDMAAESLHRSTPFLAIPGTLDPAWVTINTYRGSNNMSTELSIGLVIPDHVHPDLATFLDERLRQLSTPDALMALSRIMSGDFPRDGLIGYASGGTVTGRYSANSGVFGRPNSPTPVRAQITPLPAPSEPPASPLRRKRVMSLPEEGS